MAQVMPNWFPVARVLRAFPSVEHKLMGHERKSSGAMLRRRLVSALAGVIFHDDGHVEVDQDEVVRVPLDGVHDVVDADIAVQDLGLVT